jgi:hypothetical protein
MIGSRAFFLGLFEGMKLELENPSNSHPFVHALARAAAMMSPRSEEGKLGAEKSLEPEVMKRCELKPTMEIKRTTRIRCRGRVPTGPIASHHHVKEEKVSTPVRRSEHLWGMKRKEYKE